jgi:uncharacterized protein (DUF1501 family)
MTSTKKDPVLVVLQLSGGNDPLNTVVPYANPLYYDYRPVVRIDENQVLPINDDFAFNPALASIKRLYDEGKVAIIQGVGYPKPNRSHFRSMDIWHTCEPEKLSNDGWLGQTIRDLDPTSENVLTGVNFGRGLPKSLVTQGVPVASVGDLETYGVLTSIEVEDQRMEALDIFSQIYSPMNGRGPIFDYLAQTGMDALKGADILGTAPGKYSSTVEYGAGPVAQYMRNIAQVHVADLGSRIMYTTAPYNSFDTHGTQLATHGKLLTDVSQTVGDFFDDLKEQNASENVVLLLFTEFGRRVKDNGSGTDHGSGGIALVIGDAVKGGLYGEYPSLAPEKLLDGDLQFNNDFRGLYATLLENWMGLDSKPIVRGSFEKLDFI